MPEPSASSLPGQFTGKPPWLAGSAVAVPNVNIHHATFVGGEIRSQLTPEPSTLAPLFGASGLMLLRRPLS